MQSTRRPCTEVGAGLGIGRGARAGSSKEPWRPFLIGVGAGVYRLQTAALDARISRDIETRRADPLDLDREQKEREAWLDTLSFPPF